MAPSPPPVADPPYRDVHMDGVGFFKSSLAPEACARLAPGNFSYCVAIRSGELTLRSDFPVTETIALQAGDVVAVSGLAPHLFFTNAPPRSDAAPVFVQRAMTSAAVKAEIELIIGVVPNEALALGSLTVGPILVRPDQHPDLSKRLWGAVASIEDEYADTSWLDHDLVIRRLAEIMLINMSRRIVADRNRGDAQVQRPQASRQIIAAINAFFSSPDRALSLSDLARAGGMSRTRFSEEFKHVTGQTPARVLSRMRLTTIARRLATESLSVEAAAEAAGYSSAAAFIRAFQRQFGETPALWRRRRREPDHAPRNPRAASRKKAARETL